MQDFVEGSRSESAAEGPYAEDVRRCVFASNTLHTNFIRPNGFVMVDGSLIYKPLYAVGLDCPKYMPLHGEYTALVSERGQLSVKKIGIKNKNNQLEGDTNPDWAISGPQVVSQRKPVDMGGFPRNPQDRKYTIGDEVSYDPIAIKTSFTAFGIDDDDQIVFVSMFEKLRGLGSGCNLGINVAEMALLLITELNVKEAILGGGGADTQQFVRGDHPEFMVAPIRARRPEEGPRPEVVGPRGLGAIVGVLLKAK